MTREGVRFSRQNEVAKSVLLDDGRIFLSNNAADRTRRGIAPGRKSLLIAGSNAADGARP